MWKRAARVGVIALAVLSAIVGGWLSLGGLLHETDFRPLPVEKIEAKK